jgi:hypothetical protein
VGSEFCGIATAELDGARNEDHPLEIHRSARG